MGLIQANYCSVLWVTKVTLCALVSGSAATLRIGYVSPSVKTGEEWDLICKFSPHSKLKTLASFEVYVCNWVFLYKISDIISLGDN